MSDYYNYNFNDEVSCRSWLAKKFPIFNIIAIHGPTNSCKSSIICGMIDALVAAVKDIRTTEGPHFILAIGDGKFRQVTHVTDRGEPIVVPIEQLGADDFTPLLAAQRPAVELADQRTRWPYPRPDAMNPSQDPQRFGDLYISYTGNRLRGAFAGLIPRDLKQVLLHDAAPRFTLVNVDRLHPPESDLNQALRNTLFIDTRGIEHSVVARDAGAPGPMQQKNSEVVTAICKLATRNVYCIPQTLDNHPAEARAFERALMSATYGDSFFDGAFQQLVASAVSAAARGAMAYSGGGATAAAVAVGLEVTSGVMKSAADENSNSSRRASATKYVDPATQKLWAKTCFVRGKLDESLGSAFGEIDAYEAAAEAKCDFLVRPINKRVRHVAVPAFVREQVAAEGIPEFRNKLNQINQFEALRHELVQEGSTSFDLCGHARAYKAHLETQAAQRSWLSAETWSDVGKRVAPSQFGLNTDSWYVEDLLQKQCKK